jgi:ubiquinone/menaquinone biosynthesis C-methylase UbiE
LAIQSSSQQFSTFLQALEQRHLADLRFSDVTRALRALSSAYVERRESALAAHKALDGAGKRAAFALYYGPIHYLLVQHIVRELGVTPRPGTVVDLGCGTGVAGAAVATAVTPAPFDVAQGGLSEVERPLPVLGIDTHPWTLDEARFTYRTFGIRADVKRGHAARTRLPSGTSIVVAAFLVNELKDADRDVLLREFIRLRPDTTLLVVEPISHRISPWWDDWARDLGARADEWRARIDPPPIVKRLAKAAGLRPEVLTARSLLAGAPTTRTLRRGVA